MTALESRSQMFIGGEWVSSSGDGVLEGISPNTEEVIGQAPNATEDDVDAASVGRVDPASEDRLARRFAEHRQVDLIPDDRSRP